MDQNPDFLTATMARIYADQGHYDRAAEIYRHLLARSPERTDVADALAEAEKSLEKNRATDQDRLVSLFLRWFELSAGCRRIAELKGMSQDITGSR